MSLVKWEPMRELSRLRDEMDRVFGQSFGEIASEGFDVLKPAVDVHEAGDNLVIKADLPGIKKENVEISTNGDSITIEGHSEEEKEDKKNGYYRRERRAGRFLRTVPFPVAADSAKAVATFADGTLTITIPKSAGASQMKKIELK